jgi:hypothetical protein
LGETVIIHVIDIRNLILLSREAVRCPPAHIHGF